MALAIATGVPPQHGLYTAIIAGAVIALAGGSRFNVSGPTAAFVVILLPIVQQYGLGGLLLATIMAGIILVALGLARMGALIQFIPYPVVLGFTAGIGVVIASLQLPDFLGLQLAGGGEHFLEKVGEIIRTLPSASILRNSGWAWPPWRSWSPGPACACRCRRRLVGLALAALAAWAANQWAGASIETIASRFSWEAGGQSGAGIPPIPPMFVLPWQLPGPDGQAAAIEFRPRASLARGGLRHGDARGDRVTALRGDRRWAYAHPSRFQRGARRAGAGEHYRPVLRRDHRDRRDRADRHQHPQRRALSDRCHSACAGGAAGRGGPVRAARSGADVGARGAAVRGRLEHERAAPVHAHLALCAARRRRHPAHLLPANGAVRHGAGRGRRGRPRRCAVHPPHGPADALRQGARCGGHPAARDLPAEVAVYDVNGPLFFAAAEKAVSSLHIVDPGVRVVMLDMSDVPSMDGTAVVAVQGLVDELGPARASASSSSGLHARMVLKLRRAGVRRAEGRLTFCASMEQARKVAARWLGGAAAAEPGATA
jgi:sulfate permease, SulP family